MATTLIEALTTAIDSATSLTSGSSLFIGWMPDQPDTAVALYEYEGETPDYVMGSPVIDKPRVQIISRSASYATARDTLNTIRSLTDVHDTTLTGIDTLRVHPYGSVTALGRDDKNRWEFSLSIVGHVMR